MQILKGLGVSSGVAMGHALRFTRNALELRVHLAEEEVERELARLTTAQDRSRQQLRKIREKVARSVSVDHAGVFDAQLLMLDDHMVVARALDTIRRERINAEWALARLSDELGRVFGEVDDRLLMERQGDITDVIGRLSANLKGGRGMRSDRFKQFGGPYVLIADELPPSVAAQIDWRQIVGFATDAGSWTYHTAILARSLKVPAVVGLHDASARIPPGTWIAVDGTTGEVLVEPTPERLAALETREQDARRSASAPPDVRSRPAETLDGERVTLEANIELGADVESAITCGADGIGLYRSEYLLANGPLDTLTEDAQFDLYRSLLQGMAPRPVTVRTFDVVEEQIADPRASEAVGARSRFGLRGLRLGLANPDILRTQLRALLRAARFGRLRIMFPFVSEASELERARAHIAAVLADLRAAGETVPEVPIGAMIEVPSAVLTVDLLAPHVDFFAIGTNDLIQYCLALDRTDDRVSDLYAPLHPAVLRAIRLAQRTSMRCHLPLAVCGEMAADPAAMALLIGLGVRRFSMTPAVLPMARSVVCRLHAGEMRSLARRLLGGAPAATITPMVMAALERHALSHRAP